MHIHYLISWLTDAQLDNANLEEDAGQKEVSVPEERSPTPVSNSCHAKTSAGRKIEYPADGLEFKLGRYITVADYVNE